MNYKDFINLSKYIKDFSKNLNQVLKKLYPLRRSLIASGNNQTTKILKKKFKFILDENISFSSGERIGNWYIPKSWDLLDFSLKDNNGNVILDLSDTNLRVTSGSKSFNGKIHINDLLKKIHTKPELPDAIPYTTAYYDYNDWSICISENEKKRIMESGCRDFHVFIDVNSRNSKMIINNYMTKSKEDQFSLIWTYNCHPQLAQNELSGMVVWSILLSTLQKYERNSSGLLKKYFFAMGPETIGAISLIDYFNRNGHKPANAMVFTCLGAKSSQYTIQAGRKQNTVIEKVVEKAIIDMNIKNYKVDDYFRRGSDERQFDYPSVGIETCYYTTKKFHQYPEYHTSLDNLNLISPSQIILSAQIYLYAVFIIENNNHYIVSSYGEPKLSEINMWPKTNSGGNLPKKFKPTDILIYCDGKHDLLTISIIINQSFHELLKYVKIFEENDLIKRL